MLAFTPFVIAFERAANRALALAENRPWGDDSGRVLAVVSSHPNFQLTLSLTDKGVMLRNNTDLTADATIYTTPFALLRALGKPDELDALFEGEIRVDGDERFAFRVLGRLSRLEFDWAEWLDKKTNPMLAGLVERLARKAKKQAAHWRESRAIEQHDFWVYDSQMLPDRAEIEPWLDEVDQLRSELERLDARIAKLTHPQTRG